MPMDMHIHYQRAVHMAEMELKKMLWGVSLTTINVDAGDERRGSVHGNESKAHVGAHDDVSSPAQHTHHARADDGHHGYVHGHVPRPHACEGARAVLLGATRCPVPSVRLR